MSSKSNRITAWLALAGAVACGFTMHRHGAPLMLLLPALLWLFCAAAPGSAVRNRTKLFNLDPANLNTIASDLNLNTILNEALFAFKRSILNLRVFATVFRNVVLKGTDKVAVPYYPLEGSASQNYSAADGYQFDETSNTAVRTLGGTDGDGNTLWKRKYQSLKITGEEMARLPALNAVTLGRIKGEKLAFDVIQDILSVVTAANFPGVAFTGAPGTMDSDTIIDIRTLISKPFVANNVVTGGPWPEEGRGLLVNPDIDGSLLKDNAFKQAYSIGTAEAIQEGRLPRIFGFDYAAFAAIPSNNQYLIGMATYMSAILAAFSPIEPPPSVRKLMTAYEIVDDAASGVTIEYRQWGDADYDADKRVLECNYVYAFGEQNAIQRITSQ